MYSIADQASFDEITVFKEKILRAKEMDKVPMVLIGNKCDLTEEREVSEAQGRELAEEMGCPFMETSAKNKINNEECFFQSVREIIKMDNEEKEASGTKKKGVAFKCMIL